LTYKRSGIIIKYGPLSNLSQEKKNMIKNNEEADDIKQLTIDLRNNNLLKLAVFSDILNRYIDIHLKDKVSWVKLYLLFILVSRGGGEMPTTELGRSVLRSKFNVSVLVNSLVKEKLVTRKNYKSDRRYIFVKITEKGLDFLRDSLVEIQPMEDQIKGWLDPVELKTVVASNRKLIVKFVEQVTDKL
jgi:DNA-binding MarR family transcriptional regulator